MMKNALFGGVNAAVLTAMHADLSVDLDRMAAHCRWLLANGCNGLAILGTTGEANSLGIDERIAVMEGLVARGIPAARLLPGTGTTAITDTVMLTRRAARTGLPRRAVAAAVLLQEPVRRRAVRLFQRGDPARRRRITIYLYHFPQQSAVPFRHRLIGRLLKAYPGRVQGHQGQQRRFRKHASPMSMQFAPRRVRGLLRRRRRCCSRCCRPAAPAASPRRPMSAAPSAPKVYANWDNAAGDEAQVTLAAIRKAVTSAPLIPGLKALVARHTGDRWLAQHPPAASAPAGRVGGEAFCRVRRLRREAGGGRVSVSTRRRFNSLLLPG